MCKIRPQTILSIILYMVLFDGILINSLHFPGIIIYMVDVLLVFLVAYSIIKKKTLGTEERAIRNFVVIYMLVVTVSYMANYQNLFFFSLEDLEMFFDLLFFSLLCTIYFTQKDLIIFLRDLNRVFYLNAVIMLIQYFVFGLNQDYLGGIFGTHQGCTTF